MKANDVLDCYLYGHLYDVYHGDVRDHDPCVNHDLYDYHDHDHNDGLDMHDVCGHDVYRNDVDHVVVMSLVFVMVSITIDPYIMMTLIVMLLML